jgi:hypothetical protein
MLPAAYTTPAAVLLAVGGLVACFAGYRLFRLVLGLYGFYLGSMITTSSMGSGGSSTVTLVLAAIVGGLVGAVLMYAAYFLGVALVGAGLGAFVTNAAWRVMGGGEPPTVILVLICVLGALIALTLVRYVVIIGTAIAGSWTLIVGVLALLGHQAATRIVTTDDIWVLYPLNPIPDYWWITALWFGLTVAGAIAQLATTSAKATVARVPKR